MNREEYTTREPIKTVRWFGAALGGVVLSHTLSGLWFSFGPETDVQVHLLALRVIQMLAGMITLLIDPAHHVVIATLSVVGYFLEQLSYPVAFRSSSEIMLSTALLKAVFLNLGRLTIVSILTLQKRRSSGSSAILN
jgi:hypothetical protein